MSDVVSQMMRLPMMMAQIGIDQIQRFAPQGDRMQLYGDGMSSSNARGLGGLYETGQNLVQSMMDPVAGNCRSGAADACSPGTIRYSAIENGPVEEVIAFNNDEFIRLRGFPNNPYFSSHGPLTDLRGNVLRGSRVETSFPVDPTSIDNATTWPSVQQAPFDSPPLDPTNTTGHGYSKQAYYLNEHDSFVTVGPSLPKIGTLKNGGAQFWVGSIGVIAHGTGRFKGVRGVTTYVGSGYLPVWPETFDEQARILQAGFTALVGTYVKIVLEENVTR